LELQVERELELVLLLQTWLVGQERDQLYVRLSQFLIWDVLYLMAVLTTEREHAGVDHGEILKVGVRLAEIKLVDVQQTAF
jgi:hypothetical protein